MEVARGNSVYSTATWQRHRKPDGRLLLGRCYASLVGSLPSPLAVWCFFSPLSSSTFFHTLLVLLFSLLSINYILHFTNRPAEDFHNTNPPFHLIYETTPARSYLNWSLDWYTHRPPTCVLAVRMRETTTLLRGRPRTMAAGGQV